MSRNQFIYVSQYYKKNAQLLFFFFPQHDRFGPVKWILAIMRGCYKKGIYFVLSGVSCKITDFSLPLTELITI